MAGGTIAKLNVLLTASVGGFASSMASAARPLTDFAGSVVGTSLKIGGLVSAITGLVGAGSLAVLVHQSMDAIDANAKLSDRLGITTQSLTGLQHAAALAHVSNDELTGGFEKMLKNLAAAASNGGPAAEVLKQMGLNAKDLVNEAPDQAFKQIADGLMKIDNPAQRAAAAVAIFGKSGQTLLPMMMKGADGIAAAQAEAEKLGLTFDRVSAAKVEAANESFVRMQGIITGVGNQIAIGLSPYIAAAANKLTDLATQGGGIGPKVGGAIEWVAKAVATAADYLELLPAGFYGFRAGALEAIAGVLGAIDTLGGGLVKLLNMLPGVKLAWTDTFSTLQQGMEQVAAEEAQKFNDSMAAFHRGDNAAAVTKVFDDIKTQSQSSAEAVASNSEKMAGAFQDVGDKVDGLKKVTEMLTDLQKQVDQFGKTEGQKKLLDLQAMGATPEQLAQAKQLADQLDSMNAAKKKQEDMASKAKEVIDATRTPMEKYESTIGELSELLNAGKIDWDIYGRAVRQARGELEKASAPKLTVPELVKTGSAQALKFQYDAGRGAKTLKDDIPKKQLAQQTESARLLDRIEKNTRPIVDDDVEVDV